jgi:hypothetical protein
MVRGAEIRLEHPLELRGNGAAHQRQRVDREEGVHLEFRDVVPAQEALGLDSVVFRLVLDPAEGLGWRQIAGCLVDATEQNRHVVELNARALFDPRQRNLGKVGVGTSEIEVEFDVKRSSHRKALSPC